MKLKDNKLIRYFTKYWIGIILSVLAVTSVVLTTCGSWDSYDCKSTSSFEAIKLLFLHHEFGKNDEIDCFLEWGRWLALVFFLLFSGSAVIKFGFPTWWNKNVIRFWFKNHYVIFGNNEIQIELIRKIDPLFIVAS